MVYINIMICLILHYYYQLNMKLVTPFSMLVVGPSGSGKSVFVDRLISQRKSLLREAPETIIWCYGIWQSFYESLPYTMHNGSPTQEQLDAGNCILVVDDMMDEAQDLMSAVFTKISHHNKITGIFLTQNLFPKGKYSRNISLNANYLVLMKNVRDRAQISHLARQIYPQNSKFLVEAFQDATKSPYSYLFLDFKPATQEEYRVLTGILHDEDLYSYTTI